MSTVTITVFEDIKNAFNMGLGGQNKSAVIADLMRDAVDLEQRRKLHCNAMQCNAMQCSRPHFGQSHQRNQVF